MPMTLNPVPQPAQSLGETQNPILQNFTTISNAFNIDHVPFNAPNQGWHNQLSMPVQAVTPAVADPTLLEIYTLLNATSTRNEWYIKRSTDGVNPGIPMTGQLVSGQNGWTYLPSGIIINWGIGSCTTLVPQTITLALPVHQPHTNGNYAVLVTAQRSGGPVYTLQSDKIGATQFTIYAQQVSGGTTPCPFTWMTIGI